MGQTSNFIVFADESGEHGLAQRADNLLIAGSQAPHSPRLLLGTWNRLVPDRQGHCQSCEFPTIDGPKTGLISRPL